MNDPAHIAQRLADEVDSVVLYSDPVHHDWVAVVRGGGGIKLEVRKNGTRESALTSAVMGLFSQTNAGSGIERSVAELVARRLLVTRVNYASFHTDDI